MDVFSDVDIFRDLMDVARIGKVPVYIVLDNISFSAFSDMCDRCGVHANKLENMRVRVIKGSVYCSRTGKKFHGQVFEKFLLVDCKVTLCGSYSFTWSYEKINRSFVQVFTGQVVQIFDEEFRILYGQSDAPDSVRSPSLDTPQRRDVPDHRSPLHRKMQDARTQRFVRDLSYRELSYRGSRNSYSSVKSGGFAADGTAEQIGGSNDEDLLSLSHDRVQARIRWRQTHQQQQRDRGPGNPDELPVLFRNQRGTPGGALQAGRSTANAWKRHSYSGEIPESIGSFEGSGMLFEGADQGSVRRTGRWQENAGGEICEPARYGLARLLDSDSRAFAGTPFVRQRETSLLSKGSREGSVAERGHGETWHRQNSCGFATPRGSELFSKLSASSREATVGSRFLSSVGKSDDNGPGQPYGVSPRFLGHGWCSGGRADTASRGVAARVDCERDGTRRQLTVSPCFDKCSSTERCDASDVKGDDGSYHGKCHTSTTTTAQEKATQDMSNGDSKLTLERNVWLQASSPFSSMYKSESVINGNDDHTKSRVNAETKFPKYASQVSLKQANNSEYTSAQHGTHSGGQPLLLSRQLRTTSKDAGKPRETNSLPFLPAIGSLDHGHGNHQQTTSMNDLKSEGATGSGNRGKPGVHSLELSDRSCSTPTFADAGPRDQPQRSTKEKSSFCQEGKKDDTAMAKLKRSLKFRSLFYFSPDKGYEHCLKEATHRMDHAGPSNPAAAQEKRHSPKSSQLSESTKKSAPHYTDPASSEPASAEMNSSALIANLGPDVGTGRLVDTEAPSVTPMPVHKLHTDGELPKGAGDEVRPESNSSRAAFHGESVSRTQEEAARKAVDLTPNAVELTPTQAQELTPGAENATAEAEPDNATPKAANRGDELRSRDLLQKIDSMRRERRPYSRFEVFYKSDDDDDPDKAAATREAPAATVAEQITRPPWQPRFDADSRAGTQASSKYSSQLSRHGSLSYLNSSLRTGGGGGRDVDRGDVGRASTITRFTTQQLLQQRQLPPDRTTDDRPKDERRFPKLMQRFAVTFRTKNK